MHRTTGAAVGGFTYSLRWSRGAIEPGLLARLIAVRCPESVDDVEQYLVRGVEPELVAWPDHM